METNIPAWQRQFHIATEAASFLMVPVIFSAANKLDDPHRTMLRIFAVGMLLVDGFLLLRWRYLKEHWPERIPST